MPTKGALAITAHSSRPAHKAKHLVNKHGIEALER
jgi:hypothetical protein